MVSEHFAAAQPGVKVVCWEAPWTPRRPQRVLSKPAIEVAAPLPLAVQVVQAPQKLS